MEDASVAHCDESASEDNNLPGNGIPLDIVNGCHLAHTAALAKAVASDHFHLEENVKSEDLLNNNKEASEQDCFTNQRFVSSGDLTTVSDQISAASNPKESLLTSSKVRNNTEYKETLNHLHDSCQSTDKGKEQDRKELYNVQSNRAFIDYTFKRNIGKDISGNNELSQGELENEVLKKEMHSPCKVDLLKLQENAEDEEESDATDSVLGDQLNEKEGLEINNLKGAALSYSDILKRGLLDEVTIHNFESTTKSLVHNPQDWDETILTKNNVNNHTVHLKSSKCDSTTTQQKATLSMEHCDLQANTVCESEDGTKNCSLDFQTKRFGLCLSKNNGTKRGKRKKEHRSLKCGRLQPVSHELEFVEEEDLSEKEESSEEDNLDNSFHYSCSKDGLDHRKERHQYVSDKLDPDVLQLLEMHLRKQQLVDIKEEGEEEMLDVHINKEKSRSDSYKLLRNIPPVLDMVLEEPELEHAGDILEEGSKTPSDVDSDDSSNLCSMEMGLMESLQNDLMSKSSKIDKNEIATILRGPSPDCLSKDKTNKPSCRSECKPKHGNIQNKEPKAREDQIRDPSDLHVEQEDGPEDVGSGIVPDDVDDTIEDVIHAPLQPESCFSDSLKDASEQPSALNDKETVETPIIEKNDIKDPFQADQSSDLASLDVASNVTQQKIIEPITELDETELLDSNASNGSETALLDFAKAENASGSPCPTLEDNVKPNALCSEETDSGYPGDGGDFRKKNDSSEQHDGVQTSREIHLTDVNKALNVMKANVKSPTESSSSEAPFCITADMNTLREDLKQKILSLLEKAHAADCRSSHLQAEAELLFKESIELRTECKSLSKEAAELLSLFTQQEVLHRHQTMQSEQEGESSLCTSNTNPRDRETLSFVSKRASKKKKAESRLQVLSNKYSFLRQEGPEIMRELHILQQELKNLPSHHSKPFSFLYKWLWGGLIAGGAILLFLWNTKPPG